MRDPPCLGIAFNDYKGLGEFNGCKSFPSDEAASKLLYLVLDHAAEAWKRPPREWFEAKTQFAVIFGKRFVNV